jgi:hypothetical protein
MDSVVTTASFKAKTGKQLRHLLVGSSVRWVMSLLLCAAWVLATRFIVRDGAVTEAKKRLYNGATTGIALALGLNIASAFKDMALNMRWPILAGRDRNLIEVSDQYWGRNWKLRCPTARSHFACRQSVRVDQVGLCYATIWSHTCLYLLACSEYRGPGWNCCCFVDLRVSRGRCRCSSPSRKYFHCRYATLLSSRIFFC